MAVLDAALLCLLRFLVAREGLTMPWERDPESSDEQQLSMHQRSQRCQNRRYGAGWFLVGVLVGSLLGSLSALVASQSLSPILLPPQVQLSIRPTQQGHHASPKHAGAANSFPNGLPGCPTDDGSTDHPQYSDRANCLLLLYGWWNLCYERR